MVVSAAACGDDTTGVGGAESSSATTGNGSAATTNDVTTTSTSTLSGDATSGNPDTSTGGIFDVGIPDMGSPDEGPAIPEDCAQASRGASSVGCTFYGVYMPTAHGYGIAVTNVQLLGEAEVVIERNVGGAWEIVAGPVSVDPLGAEVFDLPFLEPPSLSGVFEGSAYRVTADRPIAAYQFTPLVMLNHESEASLLHPATSWDSLFYVPSWGVSLAYVTVVAVEDGTTVEITPSVATRPGPGVPAGLPGALFELTLDEGDSAQIAAEGYHSSLSGTRIESDPAHPIAVFSGNICSQIPQGACCCNHLEEQLSGVRSWGNRFAAARMPVRSATEPENMLWQIVASEDDTSISFGAHADVTGLPGSPAQLDRGELLEFFATGSEEHPGDFMVESNKPISVAAYTISRSEVPDNIQGDPSMVQLSPIEQFMPRYLVVSPGEWDQSALVIVREAGDDIVLDGTTIDDAAFIAIADGEFEVARVLVSEGPHALEGGADFSVVAVGYDEADCYAYMGGTRTTKLNPNPPD
jgi:hypothetical protein